MDWAFALVGGVVVVLIVVSFLVPWSGLPWINLGSAASQPPDKAVMTAYEEDVKDLATNKPPRDPAP